MQLPLLRSSITAFVLSIAVSGAVLWRAEFPTVCDSDLVGGYDCVGNNGSCSSTATGRGCDGTGCMGGQTYNCCINTGTGGGLCQKGSTNACTNPNCLNHTNDSCQMGS